MLFYILAWLKKPNWQRIIKNIKAWEYSFSRQTFRRLWPIFASIGVPAFSTSFHRWIEVPVQCPEMPWKGYIATDRHLRRGLYSSLSTALYRTRVGSLTINKRPPAHALKAAWPNVYHISNPCGKGYPAYHNRFRQLLRYNARDFCFRFEVGIEPTTLRFPFLMLYQLSYSCISCSNIWKKCLGYGFVDFRLQNTKLLSASLPAHDTSK